MKAEEYFNNHAVMNGTVLLNPIQLMEGYAESQLKAERDVKTLIIEWEQYKKSNWWESEAIDVEKVLIDQFSNLKP